MHPFYADVRTLYFFCFFFALYCNSKKTIADVGMVGLPNAGKSTFVGAVSNAHPKVAEYPFTTINPHLGVVEFPDHYRFSVADIPGLIIGKCQGKRWSRLSYSTNHVGEAC